jgi:hypothetical protein
MSKTPDVFVYDIGTAVRIGLKLDAIGGVIAAIQISDAGYVTYRCIWWSGRERKDEWLEAFEIAVDNEPTVKIGFLAAAEQQATREMVERIEGRGK